MPAIPQPLTAAAFAPYGEALTWPAAEADASGPGWNWWAERLRLPLDARPWSVGLLRLTPTPLVIEWAERHAHSAELIVPLDGPCHVYVALEGEPGHPDLGAVQVFTVLPGEAALLHPGVWHGAPFAAGGSACVLVLLPAGTGRDDTLKATFAPRRLA
ncbi:ureidoglycolate hydrolase [Deinococcus metalli]|uniref:Ureidoglycolate hydrolase n=1 Tax=Deinococcus metalli TaxID=1141878 RepID=A0A7W8KGZ4_9DEIO|nr:ureidoglycolate lyase [Deinococcus metalli]MBB5378024.1 ureidoglycolate hydrolase [Deinococcus metalli]GHF53844.1 hypothetical protein GCM10017781_32650 [Deinococcus metalli]